MPSLHGLSRAQHPVGQRQLLRAPETHQPGQEPGRAAVRRQRGGRIGHGEPGALARKDDVPCHRERHPAARSHAVDRHDDRGVHPVHHRNRRVQARGHLGQHRLHPVAGLQEEFEVAAGAEHLARAGHQHGPHRPVLVAVDHDAMERPDELQVEGVGGIRPIERHMGEAVADFVEDRVFGHRAATPPTGPWNPWSCGLPGPHAPSWRPPAHRSG